jgi:hypothetical protein
MSYTMGHTHNVLQKDGTYIYVYKILTIFTYNKLEQQFARHYPLCLIPGSTKIFHASFVFTDA